jgi:hypothetical protein
MLTLLPPSRFHRVAVGFHPQVPGYDAHGFVVRLRSLLQNISALVPIVGVEYGPPPAYDALPNPAA